MTARAAMLARAAAEHAAWLDEHADQVAPVAADSNPHDGEESDYAEHHADRSAPAAVDDLLSARLVALVAGDDPDAGPPADTKSKPAGKAGGKAGPVATEETDRPVDDAGDVILAEGWAPPVPNMLVDLREAGSDRKLRAYWVRKEGAAKIGWGTDGDFDRCVEHLGKYVDEPKGLCAEYHKAATGQWPGKGKGH